MPLAYVAGPLFAEGERWLLERVERLLRSLGFETYLPHRDTQPSMSLKAIYESHLRVLQRCDLLVAVLDGVDVDSGTAFDLGYACALGKPAVGLRTDTRGFLLRRHPGEPPPEVNIMVRFSLDAYVHDLRGLEEAVKRLTGLKGLK